MTRTFILALLLAASVAAPAVALAASGQDQKTAQPAKTINSLTIPKDATANPDGTYSYTDKQGKHWTYTNTPFGVSRVPATATAAAPAANAKLPAGVPKGAVRNADGNYVWTDAAGKKWIYAKTPFGISRTPASSAPDLKVTDKGDTVRFERPGPMGSSVWEKKKTELNDEERSAYESQKTASQQARPE